MTGGFLSVPIMRPNHCWTVLHVSILAGLLLTLNADSEDSNCDIEVIVNRNTVYKTVLGEDFRINCTVVFCNDPPPTVTWYKRGKTVNVSSSIRIKTEWERIDKFTGRGFLIFQKILTNDSGSYNCKAGESVSHYINVSVHDDDGRTNVTRNNDTRSRILDPEPTKDPWMYMYFAAGTVAFVIIVIIISIVSMRGCKGKSKKETAADNQYMALPMVEQLLPHASVQPLPSGRPHAPPSRRSIRTKTPPQPDESQLSRQNEHVYGRVNEDRERRRIKGEEEQSSVVYAALNHQLPARAAVRSQRPPEEETSEYAAIRV